MSDETKKRQPREMPPGTAIAKLRALGSCADFVEKRIDAAVTKAQDDAVNEWDKEVKKVLEKVHPSVRDAVRAAGIVPEPEGTDVPSMTLSELDSATSAIPDRLKEPLPESRLSVGRGRT